MSLSKQIVGLAAIFFLCQSQVSYRSGVALSKFLESTYRHKVEVVELGEMILIERDRFPWVSRTEWRFLVQHLSNYLRLHDDPKIWERDKLEAYGYPNELPVVRTFLAQNYGVSFSTLGIEKLSERVKIELNRAEERYKAQWFKTQGFNKAQIECLKFWESYIDILATRLSVDRAKELGFKYEPGSSVSWYIKNLGDHLGESLVVKLKSLVEFENHYFSLIKRSSCIETL